MFQKKKLLALILALMMVFSLAACGGAEETPKPAAEAPAAESTVVVDAATQFLAELPGIMIPAPDYLAKLTAGETPFTLDIRSAEDYAKGHIAGSINAPWGTQVLADNLANIPMDQPVYVYCYTGQTAGQAVGLMKIAGYDVYSIRFGYNLGLSKEVGNEAFMSTEPTDFDTTVGTEIAPEFVAMISDYYKAMETTTNKNNKIASKDLDALLAAEDDSIFVLDIRKAEDFAKGHIPTAINIPFAPGMQEQFADLPKDKTIVINCYTGQTAGQATAAMRVLGYDVISLHSGFGTPDTGDSGWSNEGFEVVQ